MKRVEADGGGARGAQTRTWSNPGGWSAPRTARNRPHRFLAATPSMKGLPPSATAALQGFNPALLEAGHRPVGSTSAISSPGAGAS
jgi:hypothetical protein